MTIGLDSSKKNSDFFLLQDPSPLNPFIAHSFIMMIHVFFFTSYFGKIFILPLNNHLGIISILFEVFTHKQFNFPMEYKCFWDGAWKTSTCPYFPSYDKWISAVTFHVCLCEQLKNNFLQLKILFHLIAFTMKSKLEK